MSMMPPPPPPPLMPPPPPAGKSQRPWWKKKRFIIPAALVLLFVVIGIAGGGSKKKDNTATVATAATTTTVVTAPTTTAAAAPATTGAPATTKAPATTTTATPTTTVPPITKDTFGPARFDPNRAAVLAILANDSDIKSVDKFVYDPAAGTVVLDITSVYSTAEYVGNAAWDLTRSFASLYEPGKGLFTTSTFTPGFTLVANGKRFACDSGIMLKLGNAEASRADWQAVCH